MKKVKIKLTVLTLFFASLLMVSCGSETTENKEEDKVLTYDVEYETLGYNKKQGKYYKDTDFKELFTGTAGTKNSDDKLINYTEFKNGFKTKSKEWEDFGGELIQTFEMEYKNGDWENGWYIDVLSYETGVNITEKYKVYKKGKMDYNQSWVIKSFDDYNSEYEFEGYYIVTGIDLVELEFFENTYEDWGSMYDNKRNYLFNFVETTNSCKGEGVRLSEVNESLIDFFECLKSQNIKNFRYHIEE